ncbi:bifunctional DNA primase/polymerase [Streptomyces coelicoflavus]|uniref:bifunctional DNA primase/polymerase n=1 Tax=Streptomyces coelicoflavus TaxID=285562 RepID=UPI0024ADB058|nr:bifunctional DNA primase/polymerase [Streptomyces coelicoflavus]MDI6518129.1 bifunctional DNA primase/polymerase [Streptomyces coelicoflavus]
MKPYNGAKRPEPTPVAPESADAANGALPDPDGLLAAALALAAEGVKVFPAHRVVDDGFGPTCTCMDLKCKSPGKHPRNDHGSKEATTDPGLIRQWWQKWGVHGRLNFGQTLTGRAVVDIDVAEGKTGDATWEGLCVELAPSDWAPGTLTYRTGRGGTQYVYTLPEGESGGKADGYSNKLGTHVDFKTGPNAYVMVPGSKTDDVYTVIVDAETAPLPEWIAEKARKKARQGSEGGSVVHAGSGSQLSDLLSLPADDPYRSSNDWVAAVAGHYAGDAWKFAPPRGWTWYSDMVRAANATSAEPHPEDRLAKTLWSVWEAEAAKHEQAEAAAVVQLLQPGGAFFHNVPEVPPAVWGHGEEILWAEGEALLIGAPQGVGKTTLAHQIIRARIGLQPTVLGLPVAPGKRVLLLAMDRPAQTRRAGARIFAGDDPHRLSERLVVWEGPPPADLARHPETLMRMCEQAGADTVVVDSLKDAAIGLSDDEVGAGWNRARQFTLREGVQVLELHHTVKRGANGAEPNTLADIYGSTWITSGAGSVISLWGEAGDPIVSLRHLKQPFAEVGPFRLLHDHTTGTTTVHHTADLVALAGASRGGISALEAAKAIFETEKPSAAQKEKARRRLAKLVEAGQLEAKAGPAGAGTVYRAPSGALF